MPSFRHEILVELFRSRGELAAEPLRGRGIVVEHARVAVGSIDLSQVASTEYRADAVVVLRDVDDRAVLGVIVEVQRHVDLDKRLSWPVYVTALRATLGCAVVLLVVTPEPDVAAWARTPIELGHPAFCLVPVVIGFDDVPWIRDRADAQRLPELAVLSVMAHPELDVATVAIHAVSGLPEDQRKLYLDVIMMALPAAVRRVVEAHMLEGYKYQSEYALRYYGQGEAEGLRKGQEAGRAAGLQLAVRTLASARIEGLADDELAAIEAVRDPDALLALISALAQAGDAVAARAVLERTRAR